MAYIALDHVEKLYHVGEVTITAVSDISFTVDKGEFVVVILLFKLFSMMKGRSSTSYVLNPSPSSKEY